MSNSIEELYYGNIEPQEYSTELTGKAQILLGALIEKEEELYAVLKGNELKLFKEYVANYIEFTSLCNKGSFISGFRLSAKFAYNTFVDEKRV